MSQLNAMYVALTRAKEKLIVDINGFYIPTVNFFYMY
jgi:hypothetical protein